ncbi:EcsC family protein [Alphaproteobacteria bacterium KMM 3653]|uniref:EcsC family protein n=1 Tax=Harenicola maris TaxID=2841044 RepID=A0AAP2G328_9RHOB|nr:EcsC family protein [Harenicola maris]
MSLPEDSRDFSGAVKAAIERQKAFEERRATRLGRGAEALTAPVGGAFARIIPASVVRKALEQADKAAGLTLPAEVTGHDREDVLACDAAAKQVQAWAQGTNAATGGAAGWFGAAGLVADIPATITLAARNVRATGAAYGFASVSDEERAFRLMVLEVATSLASETRVETIENMNDFARALNTPEGKLVLEKGGEWVTEKVVERIARQLGVTLAARKAGQIVPIIGGLVGATVNASFQADVARAARYAFRQRWLMARQLLPPPGPWDEKKT